MVDVLDKAGIATGDATRRDQAERCVGRRKRRPARIARSGQATVEVSEDHEVRPRATLLIAPFLENAQLIMKRAAGARTARGPVLPCAPATRPEVDGQEAQLAPDLHQRDFGSPPIEWAAGSQSGEVPFTPVRNPAANGEPGREVAEKRLRALAAGAIRGRHRTDRDLDLPLRGRKHAPRRRFVLHFLEGDDVGIERLHLPGDGRVVCFHPRNAAFEVGVLQMFEVPRGNAQLSGMRAGREQWQRQQKRGDQTFGQRQCAHGALDLEHPGIVH